MEPACPAHACLTMSTGPAKELADVPYYLMNKGNRDLVSTPSSSPLPLQGERYGFFSFCPSSGGKAPEPDNFKASTRPLQSSGSIKPPAPLQGLVWELWTQEPQCPTHTHSKLETTRERALRTLLEKTVNWQDQSWSTKEKLVSRVDSLATRNLSADGQKSDPRTGSTLNEHPRAPQTSGVITYFCI